MLSRKFIMPVALLSLLMIMSPLSCGEVDKTVVFPDPYVDALIRNQIGKPHGDIYQSDLRDSTTINFPPLVSGPIDLTGLEYCTSLTQFSLAYYGGDSEIVDITPLSNLPILTFLSLENTHIADLTPLSNLTGLTELRLNYCQIGDLAPLSNLTSLTSLHLNHVIEVIDLIPLSFLTSLTDVYIEGSQIIELIPLSNLTGLKHLCLRYCEIGDLSALSNLTTLTHLYLDGNQITDLTPLSTVTGLEQIDLDFNQISDISPLVENSGLSSDDILNVANNPLSTTSVDVYIPQLQQRGVIVRWSPLPTPTPWPTPTPTYVPPPPPPPPPPPSTTPTPVLTPLAPYVLQLEKAWWGTGNVVHSSIWGTPITERTFRFLEGAARNVSTERLASVVCIVECWSSGSLVASQEYAIAHTIEPDDSFDFHIEIDDSPIIDNCTIRFEDSSGDVIPHWESTGSM